MHGHDESSRQKEAYWRDHFIRWQRSGLTQREYCQEHGLALSTFQLWRRRSAVGRTEQCLDIIPVAHAPRAALFPPPATVAVLLDGGRHRIEIGDGVRVETLKAVLEALEVR
jgi:hypothetical protein